MFTHKCIKCASQYQDEDSDAYLCASCNEERKAIAAEVDKKMAGRVSERTRDLRIEDIAQKHPRYGNTPFVRAEDLGINFH